MRKKKFDEDVIRWFAMYYPQYKDQYIKERKKAKICGIISLVLYAIAGVSYILHPYLCFAILLYNSAYTIFSQAWYAYGKREAIECGLFNNMTYRDFVKMFKNGDLDKIMEEYGPKANELENDKDDKTNEMKKYRSIIIVKNIMKENTKNKTNIKNNSREL